MTNYDYQLIGQGLSGNFSLVPNLGETLTELEYANWYSGKAEAYLGRVTYRFEPKGLLYSQVNIRRDAQKLGHIELNWKGQIRLFFLDEHGTQWKFTLVHKGFLASSFELQDEQGKTLVKLESKFQWSKLNYSYGLNYEAEALEGLDLVGLFLACGYAANLYMLQGS